MRPPPGTGCGPLYVPSCASELALASLMRMSCALSQFSCFPPHVLRVVACRALPYENVSDHGALGHSFWSAFRLMLLSSSDIPPDKKWMPGTAAGTVRSIVRTVYLATSSGEATGASRPGRHMLGLRRMQSSMTSYSFSMRKTCE